MFFFLVHLPSYIHAYIRRYAREDIKMIKAKLSLEASSRRFIVTHQIHIASELNYRLVSDHALSEIGPFL